MDILGGTLVPGDDASEAAFFASSSLPSDIAFRAHRQALQDFFDDGMKRKEGLRATIADRTMEGPET
jgi:hypothetical protein